MAQILTQTQRQEQRQQLSAQQVLVARLTELSVEELRAAIETECEGHGRGKAGELRLLAMTPILRGCP